jgi:hypothetical protein
VRGNDGHKRPSVAGVAIALLCDSMLD